MEENGQYKSELYSKFKDIGLLDTLKSQMRYKILEKLQVPSTKPSPALNNSSLINKIVNSLISEHLKIQNFNYTLAVFLPEIGKDLLSFEEIIEILNVQKENAKPDLLESLIETFLTKKPKVWEKMNISTQTENLDNIIGLESRLKGVDAEYKKKIGAIEAILPKTLEEKFLVYKKELEKRTKLEMQAELTRIREIEFSLVRIEEAEKHKSNMEEYREDLEKLHQERLSKLRYREKETIEKCNDRLRFIEAANHEHRQKLLKDFELLKMREDDLDKQRVLSEESLKLDKVKLEHLEQEYKGKIQELEDLKKGSQAKYDHELAYNKLNLIKEVEEDRLSIYQKNKHLEEELLKLNQMKETIARFSLQNSILTKENTKLNEEILNLRQKKKEYSSELEQMKEQNRLLMFNSQRDQDHLKHCEIEVRGLKEENERLNVNLKEKQGLFEEQMILKQEIMKKKNNEISEYQEKNEELKKKIEIFKRNEKENQGKKEMNNGFVTNKEEFSVKLKEQESLKKKLKDELLKISEFEDDIE